MYSYFFSLFQLYEFLGCSRYCGEYKLNKAQSSEGETGMPSTKGKDTGVASRNKLRDPQAEKEKKEHSN